MTAAKRILLVEDDAVSLKLMRDVLESHGYATNETGDGAAAMALARSEAFDLVVMDIGLPGLDGVEATRQIRGHERMSGVPVVAVTAYAMPADEQRMREAGCDAFLTKPLRLADFVALVRALLGDDDKPANAP